MIESNETTGPREDASPVQQAEDSRVNRASAVAGEATSGPFGRAALAYRGRGWPGTLPAKEGEDSKKPQLSGWLGNSGGWPKGHHVKLWLARFSDRNLLLRLNPGTVGIDVDAYEPKQGGKTLAELEAEHGELPATWRSSSRADDPVSGIRWFRAEPPEGRRWKAEAGPGIELVHATLRYAVVPPSIHPKTGQPYRWYGPDGERATCPRSSQLPELPDEWVEALTVPDVAPPAAHVHEGPPKFAEGQQGTKYGRKALALGLRELQDVWDGNVQAWNPVLNRVAFAAAQLAAGGELDPVQARQRIEDVMHELAAPADQYKTLESAWKAGLAQPRSAPPRDAPEPPTAPGDSTGREEEQDVPDEQDPADSIPGLDELIEQLVPPNVSRSDLHYKLNDLRALHYARKVLDAEQMLEEGDASLFKRLDWSGVDLTDETRLDSAGVAYDRGRVILAGPSESGKTLLAYWLLLRWVREGRKVAIIDLEMGQVEALRLLKFLGATDDELAESVIYYDLPDMLSLLEQGAALNRAMERDGADVLVVDAIIPVVMEAGLDNNSAVDVRRVIRRVSEDLIKRGGLVYLIDHTNKQTKEGPGGSIDKKNAVDQMVMVSVNDKDRFAKGKSGKVSLTLGKDRRGLVGSGAKQAVRVTANADHTVELTPLGWRRDEPDDTDQARTAAEAATANLTTLPACVAALKRHGPATPAQLAELTGIAESKIRSSLNTNAKSKAKPPLVKSIERGLWKAL